jgi:hypothetical protein
LALQDADQVVLCVICLQLQLAQALQVGYLRQHWGARGGELLLLLLLIIIM